MGKGHGVSKEGRLLSGVLCVDSARKRSSSALLTRIA